jgi:acyl carrier protein
MRLSPEEIEGALARFINDEILLRKEPLGREEDLFAAGFDSLSLSRTLVFVEERFGVRIPDEDVVVDEVATLSGMARFVLAHAGKGQT